jgi:hypothetical protein
MHDSALRECDESRGTRHSERQSGPLWATPALDLLERLFPKSGLGLSQVRCHTGIGSGELPLIGSPASAAEPDSG